MTGQQQHIIQRRVIDIGVTCQKDADAAFEQLGEEWSDAFAHVEGTLFDALGDGADAQVIDRLEVSLGTVSADCSLETLQQDYQVALEAALSETLNQVETLARKDQTDVAFDAALAPLVFLQTGLVPWWYGAAQDNQLKAIAFDLRKAFLKLCSDAPHKVRAWFADLLQNTPLVLERCKLQFGPEGMRALSSALDISLDGEGQNSGNHLYEPAVVKSSETGAPSENDFTDHVRPPVSQPFKGAEPKKTDRAKSVGVSSETESVSHQYLGFETDKPASHLVPHATLSETNRAKQLGLAKAATIDGAMRSIAAGKSSADKTEVQGTRGGKVLASEVKIDEQSVPSVDTENDSADRKKAGSPETRKAYDTPTVDRGDGRTEAGFSAVGALHSKGPKTRLEMAEPQRDDDTAQAGGAAAQLMGKPTASPINQLRPDAVSEDMPTSSDSREPRAVEAARHTVDEGAVPTPSAANQSGLKGDRRHDPRRKSTVTGELGQSGVPEVNTAQFIAGDFEPESMPSHPAFAKAGAPEWQSLVGASEMAVLNAGTVLLWPFLSTLFKKLDWLGEEGWHRPFYAHKAAHLLHYLATGDLGAAEHMLAMNKVICGIDFGEPMSLAIDFSESELAEAEALLRAVCQHWPQMRGTSVDGLRSTFLSRRGLLSEHDERWLLRVEPEPFDMLLEGLPWSYSTIMLSWMEKMLEVEW